MSGPAPSSINRDRIALGVQQPWAELILRGVKRIEVRSQLTRQRGTIYLYASKRWSALPFAEPVARRYAIDRDSAPAGVIVGTVDIVDARPCTAADERDACVPASILKGQSAWVLENPRRYERPLEARFLPYGIWFYPFQRRSRR